MNLTSGKQRVLAAMQFREADRVPRFWPDFWPEFQDTWRQRRGHMDVHVDFGDDMRLVSPEESAWPTRAVLLGRQGKLAVVRSGWGEVKLSHSDVPAGQVMGKLMKPAITERTDPALLQFDDPRTDQRFVKAGKEAVALKDHSFVWCKCGGPYSRATFMRGDEQLWIDLSEDPEWVRALADRLADHLIAVAIEGMQRFGLQGTGIAIYDDVAACSGPLISPKHYERIFLPSIHRMIKSFKAAGAHWIMYHSDGNVLPLLDMWIDAGVNAINPVEFRAGMDPVKIREKYGSKLVCVGGLDNSDILPRGDRGEIRDHVLHLLEAGRGGGYVFGPHSIGPDIRCETMEYILELLAEQKGHPLSSR